MKKSLLILSVVTALASAGIIKDKSHENFFRNKREDNRREDKASTTPVRSQYPFRRQSGQNDRPVIGVLSQPLSYSQRQDPLFDGYYSYIMADYVQFLESAGARVVPIVFGNNLTHELSKVSHLNGILFAGGGAGSKYVKFAKEFYLAAKKLNDNGTYFPLWGTCLGFENLAMFASDLGENVTEDFNATHVNLPVKFLENPSKTRMWSPLQDEADIFTKENLTFHAHSYGISVEQFSPSVDKGLASMFVPTSTSEDSNGKTFVSSMESPHYPFYGTQFHPEKMQFTWYPKYPIEHDPTAVYYNRYFADFFVNEARKNLNSFPGTFKEQQALLVENYKLEVLGNYDGMDYVFA